jgi:hypothetical protein
VRFVNASASTATKTWDDVTRSEPQWGRRSTQPILVFSNTFRDENLQKSLSGPFNSKWGAVTALEECLRRLATLYGDGAYQELKSLRDELIRKFKNADIPANREMEHAQLVRPAIEVLEIAFDDVLRRLRSGGPSNQ